MNVGYEVKCKNASVRDKLELICVYTALRSDIEPCHSHFDQIRSKTSIYSSGEPRLQAQYLNRCRQRGFSHRTVKTYWHWIRQYLKFFNFKHPRSLTERHVEEFLSHLALHRNVSKATQNIAFNALRFIYVEVLVQPFDNVQAIRVKRDARVPEVFNHDEAMRVIEN